MTNPDEIRYRILRALDENPHLSQRDLARELGVSLGKANYCLRTIMSHGWIDAVDLRGRGERRRYAYILTTAGLEEKDRVTLRYLNRRLKEHEAIKREIDELRREASDGRLPTGFPETHRAGLEG